MKPARRLKEYSIMLLEKKDQVLEGRTRIRPGNHASLVVLMLLAAVVLLPPMPCDAETLVTQGPLDHLEFRWSPDGSTIYSAPVLQISPDSSRTRTGIAATPASGGSPVILRGQNDNALYDGADIQGLSGQPDIVSYRTDLGGPLSVVAWIRADMPDMQHILSTSGTNSPGEFNPGGTRVVNTRTAAGDTLSQVIVTTYPGGAENAWTPPGTYGDATWYHHSNAILCTKLDPQTGYFQLYRLNGPMQEQRLTDQPFDHIRPRLSPNDSLCVCVRWNGDEENNVSDLFLFTTPFTTGTAIGAGGAYNGFAEWSPNSRWLVYETYQNEKQIVAYRVSDGLTYYPLRGLPHRDRVLPQFSPDGSRLGYLTSTNGGELSSQVWTEDFSLPAPGGIEADGTNSPVSTKIALTPNPFTARSGLTIDLERGAAARTEVGVYDLSGRLLKSLKSDDSSNRVRVHWDGETAHGRVSSGIYLIRVKSGAAELWGKALYLE